jgi:hypothetical protein
VDGPPIVSLGLVSTDPPQEGDGTGGLVAIGKVLDAATGKGVAGARVLVTGCHASAVDPVGAEDPAAGEAGWRTAGVPALVEAEVETTAGGVILVERFRPEDPRLLLHVQVDHADYAPAVAIIGGRDGADGRWDEAEILLRAARTAAIRVARIDDRGRTHALGRVPVQVTPRVDGTSFLEGEVAAHRHPLGRRGGTTAHGRLVRPGAPRVQYTDRRGDLRLEAGSYAYDLELLDPHHYLVHKDAESGEVMAGRITVLPGIVVEAHAFPGLPERHVLLDKDGFPAGGAEIEVALEGMTPLTLLTDAEGWFSLGLMPFPAGEPPLSYSRPRRGTLSVLSPELLGRSAPVAFPSSDEEVVVNGRLAGRLLLRLGSAEGVEAGLPLVPAGVALSCDMTLVGLQASGEVELRGELPAAGAAIEVVARGFLPSRVIVPETGGSAGVLDLGDVLLARGWRKTIVIPEEAAGHGARLLLRYAGDHPFSTVESQEYRIPEDGRVEAGGLRRGSYDVGVEGPGVRTFTGRFEILETELEEPLVLPVELSGEEEVRVSGRVVDLDPLQAAGAVVVERFLVDGVDDPVAMTPYPLAPDGRLGSVRRLRAVEGVHVSVIDPSGRAADFTLRREPGAPASFDAGELRLERAAELEASFFVEGYGRVDPPLRVALEGEGGIEAVARLRLRDRHLVIENLRPVAYRLRWLTAQGVEEVAAFEGPAGRAAPPPVRLYRSPLAEEVIEIRVIDSAARPIAGALIEPPAPPPFDFVPEAGTYLAVVRPRRTSAFSVRAPGFLPARVEAPPGAVVPTEVRLYRGTPVRALLIDTDGAEVEGEVRIRWESLTPSFTSHGEETVVRVEDGRLEGVLCPPLPLLYTFQLEGAPVSVERQLTVPEGERVHDLGTIRFSESRSLHGTVVTPDGSPAAGAAVLLLPAAESYRFPLRESREPEKSRDAAKADATGSYRLEGLPRDLPQGLVLVARLDGYGDAVEDPLDLEAETHDLELQPAAGIEINVGYQDGVERDQYRFTLEYARDPLDPESRIELGEIAPHLWGLHTYRPVEPGFYRLRWGLREAYQPLPGLWQDVEVVPGLDVRVALELEGRLLRGAARLNGALVEKGWLLVTGDPGIAGSASVGRIIRGQYHLIDPPLSLRGFAAVIPEGTPQALQNPGRGEALPVPVGRYRSAVREGALDFEYTAYTLTIRFGDDFLERHPGAFLSYQGAEWDGTRFRSTDGEELIEEPIVHFHLLQPGLHRVSARSPRGGLIASRIIDLRGDAVMDFR